MPAAINAQFTGTATWYEQPSWWGYFSRSHARYNGSNGYAFTTESTTDELENSYVGSAIVKVVGGVDYMLGSNGLYAATYTGRINGTSLYHSLIGTITDTTFQSSGDWAAEWGTMTGFTVLGGGGTVHQGAAVLSAAGNLSSAALKTLLALSALMGNSDAASEASAVYVGSSELTADSAMSGESVMLLHGSGELVGASSASASARAVLSMPPLGKNPVIDNDDPLVSYSSTGWSKVTGSFYGGTAQKNTLINSIVTVRFYGTGLTYTRQRGTDCGIVTVTCDGQSFGTVDNYSTSSTVITTQPISGLPLDWHTAYFRVSSKRAASSGYVHTVDCFRMVTGETGGSSDLTATASLMWTGSADVSAGSELAGSPLLVVHSGATVGADSYLVSDGLRCAIATASVGGNSYGAADGDLIATLGNLLLASGSNLRSRGVVVFIVTWAGGEPEVVAWSEASPEAATWFAENVQPVQWAEEGK